VPGTPPGDGHSEAETHLCRAIDVARRQHAKFQELRAVMSLSRLWQTQGKYTEARSMLEETYGWFTEGFDTPDLSSARALLAALP
jgi:predicted ATPase